MSKRLKVSHKNVDFDKNVVFHNYRDVCEYDKNMKNVVFGDNVVFGKYDKNMININQGLNHIHNYQSIYNIETKTWSEIKCKICNETYNHVC